MIRGVNRELVAGWELAPWGAYLPTLWICYGTNVSINVIGELLFKKPSSYLPLLGVGGDGGSGSIFE